MFGLNFDKLKTNFALKAVYRVKNHLKIIKNKISFLRALRVKLHK